MLYIWGLLPDRIEDSRLAYLYMYVTGENVGVSPGRGTTEEMTAGMINNLNIRMENCTLTIHAATDVRCAYYSH